MQSAAQLDMGHQYLREYVADTMTGYYEVLTLLTAACPTFADSRAESEGSADDGEFVEVGRFAAHLIDLLAQRQTECFDAVFAVIERVLRDGDPDARSLVSAGLLDDLTNRDFYPDTADPADFVPWFGEEARRYPSVHLLLRRST
jgi:hypothetical protein